MAVAKSKSSELVDRLHDWVKSGFGNDLELQRLEREAKALIGCADHAIVAEALNVLGYVHFLKGRDAEGHECFQRAIRLYPDRVVKLNRAAALTVRFFHKESLEYSVELARQYPDDLEMLHHAYKLARMTLHLDHMKEAHDSLRRLKQDGFGEYTEGPEWHAFRQKVEQKPGGFSTLLKLFDAAGAVARDHGLIHDGTAAVVTDDGEAIIHFRIKADVWSAAATSSAIADALVEQFDDPWMDVVTFGCQPNKV